MLMHVVRYLEPHVRMHVRVKAYTLLLLLGTDNIDVDIITFSPYYARSQWSQVFFRGQTSHALK